MATFEAMTDRIYDQLSSLEFALIVLGRGSCQDCTQYHGELRQWVAGGDGPGQLRVLTLNLDSPLGQDFKDDHEWVRHIDTIPYNALMVKGVVVKNWSGGTIQRLMNRLDKVV